MSTQTRHAWRPPLAEWLLMRAVLRVGAGSALALLLLAPEVLRF